MISLDTETTGVDFYHGARPFFVTTCTYEGELAYWQWPVDPLTREPEIPPEDIREITEHLLAHLKVCTAESEDAGGIILQNAKFDFKALDTLGLWQGVDRKSFWSCVYDTLIAGHLLASNQPHDLTTMSLHYLGVNIEPYEQRLDKAVQECRRLVQQAKLKVKRGQLKDPKAVKSLYESNPLALWAIAEEGHPQMPSATKKLHKFDSWLPRAIARHFNYPEDHPYWSILAEYANVDSSVTVQLWPVMRDLIKRRGLWAIFKETMKVVPLVPTIEQRGITVSAERLTQLEEQYRRESNTAAHYMTTTATKYDYTCQECAKANKKILKSTTKTKKVYNPLSCRSCKGTGQAYYKLEIPKGGRNESLETFLFDVLKLPVLKKTDAGGRAMSQDVFEYYLTMLEGEQLEFIKALAAKRKRDTALTYMSGYRRFWLPIEDGPKDENGLPLWYVMHPSLNMTGTDTLRWSSTNPNEQNVSRKEGFNLRYAFGPAPGREWWSLDAQNIELRLPAYEAGEGVMIELFERPDDPPYFGSNHLLVAHTLHPIEFEECINEQGQLDGRIFKKKYASTLYQWTKNGNFAVQYGAIESSGTADRAYHMKGAQAKVQQLFTKQAKLNKWCIAFANKHGYIETIPDKIVDPTRGYPLMCTRTESGYILPTVPLNYRIQGSACWWMRKAMTRCQDQLDIWNATDTRGYFIIIQVHDELVFDFPVGTGSEPWRTNLAKIRKIKQLMQLGGDDIGIPTPVSCEYHTESWSKGVSV